MKISIFKFIKMCALGQVTQVLIVSFLLLFLSSCQSLDRNKVSKDEDIISSQLAVAVSQIDQGRPHDAIQTIKPLSKAFPNNYDIITILGMGHLALNNNERATLLLRKAYNIRPQTAAGLNLSSALIAEQSFKKAKNVLRALIKQNDKNYEHKERILHNLGYVYEKEGKINLAVKYYKKALSNSPNYYQTLMQLAKLYKKYRNFEKAKNLYKRASRTCALCLEPTHTLATLHINSKNYRDAKNTLTTYLSLKNLAPEDRASARSLFNLVKKYNSNHQKKSYSKATINRPIKR